MNESVLAETKTISLRVGRRAVRRLGAPVVAISLVLMAVGTVLADSPGPSTIHVTKTGALTVQVSGTWTWPEMASAAKLSYAGFAIDWGDITNGNDVGPYHIGDGTSATNVVIQPTSPAQGPSGSFGPVSHTYAAAGSYTVCVIVYDLGQVTPFKTTGYHSLQAGGTGRNVDNSVDQKLDPPVQCATIEVTAPSPSATESFEGATATPFESFEGATAGPITTPPPTSTAEPSSSDPGLPLLALAALFGSLLASALIARAARLNR